MTIGRPTSKKSLADWRAWFLYRQVRSRWWQFVAARRAASLSKEEFKRRLGLSTIDEAAVQELHDRMRMRFFFHPRNRKDFFLNVLTSLQPYEDILREADETAENKFATLGSGLVELGATIRWQHDFTADVEWPLEPSHTLDVLQLGRSSDVKVPWELSRFHQAWWLGKAYWLTGQESYADKFRSLIESWIDSNPLGRGVNWCLAMEASIRACNWVAGYAFFCGSRSIPPAFWLRFFRSLYQHALFIEHNLEFSLARGNHFLSNVTGLVVLGSLFRESADGKRWYEWGVRQLETEMGRQVYSDGVNWEKSTSYQRLVLELFVVPTLMAERSGHQFSQEYLSRLHAMFRFIAAYQRPDGTIPLVGDADDGRLYRIRRDEDINDLRHILSVGAIRFADPILRDAAGGFRQDALWLLGGEGFERLRLVREDAPHERSQAFPEGGFYVLKSHNVQVFADAGDIGMDGRGGHGHNDTFSFEYWSDGAPLIVDPGTYSYTSDTALRQRLRGTRSHNTVIVDETELAEFTGLWNIAEDPTRPEVLAWNVDHDRTELQAQHHAYERLHLPVRHRRTFTLSHNTGRLTIDDVFEGSGAHRCVASLHVAPTVRVVFLGGRSVVLARADAQFQVVFSTGEIIIEPAVYSRSFGVREMTSVIRVRIHGQLPLRLTSVIERSQSAIDTVRVDAQT